MTENRKSIVTIVERSMVKNEIQKIYGIPFRESYGDTFDEWIDERLDSNDSDVKDIAKEFGVKWDLTKI